VDRDEWVQLARVEDCPPGRGCFVCAGDHELAIFHLLEPERFVVVRNSCPHAGGNLAAGEVLAGTVTCPWHHWTFDLDSGTCTLADNARLRRYRVKIEDGFVWAKLPRT